MEPEPKTRTIVMAPYWVSILSEMNKNTHNCHFSSTQNGNVQVRQTRCQFGQTQLKKQEILTRFTFATETSTLLGIESFKSGMK